MRALRAIVSTTLATAGAVLVAGPSQAADVSAKAYVEYKKAVVSITPTKAAINAAKANGYDTPQAITYQPNVVPSVGGGFDIYGVGASHSVSLPQSASQKRRGETKYKHTEVHVTRWSWLALDVQRQHYEGYFQRTHPMVDADPLGDTIFKQGESYPQYPNLTVTHDGAAALVSLRPGSFALKDAVSTAARPRRTGWAPTLMLSASRVVIESPDALVPAEQSAYFGDDAALTGGTFVSVGLLPGLGFTLAAGGWHLTPIVSCGPTLQAQEFTGIDRSKERMRGGACDLRGSMGVTTQSVAAGLVGYKTIQTITAETVNVSPANSSLQLYVAMRL